MKRAPPPASFWHATLGSENLIILITIPSWEIHQLSWVGRGDTIYGNMEEREQTKERVSVCQ